MDQTDLTFPLRKPEKVIIFKLTSRQRPDKFQATVENIIANCENKHYFILASADDDDPSMRTPYMMDYCRSKGVTIIYGKSNNKVHAINRDMDAFNKSWQILVNMSDDMAFVYKGFDNDIRAQFNDGLDWFVHFPDNNRKDICTLSIMGYDYYKRFNYIYHPDYITVCCDEEATEVAKILGRYKFIDRVIVNHYHPGYGTAEWDALYTRNEAENIYNKDRDTLKLRRWQRFLL